MNATKAIDLLFDRLYVTYGAEWERSMGSLPIAAVKTHWLNELSPYLQSTERAMSIAWALDNLPERAPNVVQFKSLCRQAPAVEQPRLPEPAANPDRMRAELAKLAERPATRGDDRAWARSILAQYKAGLRKSPAVVLMARQALGEA